jgi:hypothetical protein
MAVMAVVSLMAAQVGAAIPPASASPSWSSRVSAPARATVRILSGAKVTLSSEAQPEGYKLNAAHVRLEDGSSRPAKLVEFQ